MFFAFIAATIWSLSRTLTRGSLAPWPISSGTLIRSAKVAQIGADALETWSRGLELFNAERAKHDSAQFYDVDYVEFIADPAVTVETVYRHFDLPYTDAARAAVTAVNDASKKGPRAPKHAYALADYGLTAEQVKERFAGL